MVRMCCLKSCKSSCKTKNLRFFRIPAILKNQGEATYELSAKRRNLWLKTLGLGAESIKGHTRICSKHFVSGSPSTLFDQTHPDWLPTPDLTRKATLASVKKAFKRYNRRKNRLGLKQGNNVTTVHNEETVAVRPNDNGNMVPCDSILVVNLDSASEADDASLEEIRSEAQIEPAMGNVSQQSRVACDISALNFSVDKSTQTELNVMDRSTQFCTNVADNGARAVKYTVDSSAQAVVHCESSSTQTQEQLKCFQLEKVNKANNALTNSVR